MLPEVASSRMKIGFQSRSFLRPFLGVPFVVRLLATMHELRSHVLLIDFRPVGHAFYALLNGLLNQRFCKVLSSDGPDINLALYLDDQIRKKPRNSLKVPGPCLQRPAVDSGSLPARANYGESTMSLRKNLAKVLSARLGAAIDRGQLEVTSLDGRLVLGTVPLADLLTVLLPEEFPSDRPVAKTPTDTAPGSDFRIDAYAVRVNRKQAIFHPRDARADGPGRGLKITQRSNGSGVKVLGWEERRETRRPKAS
jgi:hypothetical protein